MYISYTYCAYKCGHLKTVVKSKQLHTCLDQVLKNALVHKLCFGNHFEVPTIWMYVTGSAKTRHNSTFFEFLFIKYL